MRRDDIRRLSEQRKSIHSQMLQLNEVAEKEQRSFSSDEQEKFDKMATDFEEIQDREERAVKLFMQDREVEKTVGTPIEKRVGYEDAPNTYKEFQEQRRGVKV